MADTDDLIQEYLAGKSVPKLSQEHGIPRSTIYSRLYAAGVTLRSEAESRRLSARADRAVYSAEVVRRFRNGESVKSLATEFNVERSNIHLCLADKGVTPRNRSESMFARMSKTSLEERKELVAHANEAMRHLPPDFHKACSEKQAIRKQASLAKVGAGEAQFMHWLQQRGYEGRPQIAVGVYNIDILLRHIAVEIHINSGNPHAMPYYRKRIIKLLNSGYDVLYIKVSKQRQLESATANYAIAFLKMRDRVPSMPCEYRMIRGDGEFVTGMSLDCDKNTLIPVPCHHFLSA